jgi:sulfatase modifying factor 1
MTAPVFEQLEPRLLLSTAPSITDPSVNGTSVSAGGSVNVEMASLSTFNFSLTAKNSGDFSPGPYNNISVSFPQLDAPGDTGRVTYSSKPSDLNYNEFLGFVPGGDGNAEYVLVEFQDTDGWQTNESNSVVLSVQPKAYGAFYVQYRVNMSSQSNWDTGWTNCPSSSAYSDCLGPGYYVYRITVNIVQPNTPPTITSLSDSPDPVVQGGDLTLTANGVTDGDGQVTRVEFYRDTNGSGDLNVGIDEHLGNDTSSSGGWTWTGSTSGFPVGVNRLFARAFDDHGDSSTPKSTTVTVQAPNTPPSVSLVSPLVETDDPTTLFAWASSDTDGDSLANTLYISLDGDDPFGWTEGADGSRVRVVLGAEQSYHLPDAERLWKGSFAWGVESTDEHGAWTRSPIGHFAVSPPEDVVFHEVALSSTNADVYSVPFSLTDPEFAGAVAQTAMSQIGQIAFKLLMESPQSLPNPYLLLLNAFSIVAGASNPLSVLPVAPGWGISPNNEFMASKMSLEDTQYSGIVVLDFVGRETWRSGWNDVVLTPLSLDATPRTGADDENPIALLTANQMLGLNPRKSYFIAPKTAFNATSFSWWPTDVPWPGEKLAFLDTWVDLKASYRRQLDAYPLVGTVQSTKAIDLDPWLFKGTTGTDGFGSGLAGWPDIQHAQVADVGANKVAQVSEGSDGYIGRTLPIPLDASQLTFDYCFTQRGDGDSLEAKIGEHVVWARVGIEETEPALHSSGPIDISVYAGQTVDLKLRLHSVGAPNSQVWVDNVSIFTPDITPPTAVGEGIINGGMQQRSRIDGVVGSFSEDVSGTFSLSSIRLYRNGVEEVPLTGVMFSFDPATNTLSLDSRGILLEDGNYEFRLYPDGITDRAGNSFDVDWDGVGDAGTGKYLSGSFHKLTGDADGNKTVTAADMLVVKKSMGKSAGQPGFDPNADLDGNGVVNALDLALARDNLTHDLLTPPTLVVEESSGTPNDGAISFGSVIVGDTIALPSAVSAGVNIETVTVGNPGNAADTTGFGAVGYTFNMGKYEVTAGQYTLFLNAVAKTDTYGLYNAQMWSDNGCQIQQSGSSGNYTYSVASDYANRPVDYVSFWDGCRFANWLQNGQPTGLQGAGTTETGAYTLTPTGINDNTINRNPGWQWAVTSENEWYKAAYHKNDGVTGNYFMYPTSSNSISTAQANYNSSNMTGVGSYAYPSPYGTADQGGNVWEWNDTITIAGTSCRGVRGGAFNYNGNDQFLRADNHDDIYGSPTGEYFSVGFRVASAVLEPAPPLGPVDIVVRNAGEKPLTLGGLQLAGVTPAAFAFEVLGEPAGNTGLTLGAGESRTIRITFTPTDPADYSAELRFWQNDDAADNPYTLSLSGHATVVNHQEWRAVQGWFTAYASAETRQNIWWVDPETGIGMWVPGPTELEWRWEEAVLSDGGSWSYSGDFSPGNVMIASTNMAEASVFVGNLAESANNPSFHMRCDASSLRNDMEFESRAESSMSLQSLTYRVLGTGEVAYTASFDVHGYVIYSLALNGLPLDVVGGEAHFIGHPGDELTLAASARNYGSDYSTGGYDFAFSVSADSQPSLGSGALFTFDEGGGTAITDSTGNYTGVTSGSFTSVETSHNGADPYDSYLVLQKGQYAQASIGEINYEGLPGEALVYSFWLWPRDPSWAMCLDSTLNLQLSSTNDWWLNGEFSVAPDPSLEIREWNHVYLVITDTRTLFAIDRPTLGIIQWESPTLPLGSVTVSDFHLWNVSVMPQPLLVDDLLIWTGSLQDAPVPDSLKS